MALSFRVVMLACSILVVVSLIGHTLTLQNRLQTAIHILEEMQQQQQLTYDSLQHTHQSLTNLSHTMQMAELELKLLRQQVKMMELKNGKESEQQRLQLEIQLGEEKLLSMREQQTPVELQTRTGR